MKISKKLVLNIIGLILLTNLIAIFIISNNTPKIFWNYLYKEKNKEIINIKESITNNIKPDNTFDKVYLEHLQRHADVQNLFIEVRNENTVIYSSGKDHIQNYNLNELENGMVEKSSKENNKDYTEQYVEKDFKLFHDRNVLLEIGYYENNTLEETIQLFSGKFVILTLLSIIFSSLIGIVASIFVSKQLSKPIYKLNENAKLMLQGNYSDVNIVNTKITEIDELSNSIVELSDSISNQENIRKEMVQNLAHDIRTPLTVLKTHFEAVLDGVIELDERNIKILNSEIDRLMNLIKKLDNLTEITRTPSTNELNISMETESIIELFWMDAKKNDITIIQDIEPNLQLIVEKSDYYQLLQNLINNAIKYNNKNGNIYVNLYKNKENIILEIKDTGIGIDQNKLKYIFERFYRNDTSRSREVQGNGLGLAIVKELIQRMNATISVESKINEGTQFTICFNLLSNKSI
ncbi:MAG: HAMP domain-containing sensor histidine kinase [Leptotrichiaceae bacterium]